MGNHTSRGHLNINLTSPDGMTSVMVPGGRPEENIIYDWMKFTSVRHWGEDPIGDWTISIRDTIRGEFGDCSSYPWEFELNDTFSFYPRNDTVYCQRTDINDDLGRFCDGEMLDQDGM